MSETREFPIAVIVSLSSATTLCGRFSEIAEAAEFLMGHPIWTHHYADKTLWAEMQKTLAEQCPGLPSCIEDVTPENVKSVVAKLEVEFGKTVVIRKGGGLTALLPTDGLPQDSDVIVLAKATGASS